MSAAWSSDRPTAPGAYLCRFVPGYEFVVTVTAGAAGLIATWRGQAVMAVPVYVWSGFFDRAQWCTQSAVVAPAPAEASA